MAAEIKEHRVNAMTQRIENESRQLPYRWGYFQGVFLIPWSLLIIGGTWMELRRPEHEPLYLSIIALLLGLIGLPLAIGLLRKRKFALPLVYLSFGLGLVLVIAKLPIATSHFRDSGDRGSSFFEAEQLFFWLCCLLYYRKRKSQFT
jgi:hypothetical protein